MNFKTPELYGFLIALALVVSVLFVGIARAAPTTCQVANGCTGTSTAPVYGDLLIGGKSGEYEYVSTSTLIGASGVTSVFGRTGAITAQSGDYTTSQVTEGSNLYFTTARAVSALTGQNVSIFANDASYLTPSTFDTDFDTRLSATTSLPNITTLAGLSLPYTQLTGTPNLAAYFTLANWYATTSAPQLTTLANLATVGTISTGVWNGTAIADSYISSSGNWNTAYTDRITSANYPLSISSNVLSTVATSSENCTISCFASANISQWTNNAGYITSSGIESTSTDPFMATYFVATSTTASNLPYASSTAVSATTFLGALTGNASTATTLQTARTINGVSFDGSANITVASTTLLTNTNTWTLLQVFANATSTLFGSTHAWIAQASTTDWSITSTSTGTSGINLSGGCFAINGTCIGSGSGGSGSSAWPFTPSTYNGQSVQATSTGLWLTGSPLSLTASTTFSNYASSTDIEGTLYANEFAGSDIGAQINAAYATAATGTTIMVPPSSGGYSFSTQIAFTGGQKYVTLQCSPGTVLTYTGTGTSTPIDVNADKSQATAHEYSWGINGCTFVGPSDSGTTAGVEITGSEDQGGEGALLNNITVKKFGIGLAIGSNTWVTNVNNSGFTDNGEGFVFEQSSTSGERLSFDGDVFADTPSATVADCINLNAGAASVFFSNSSFDGCFAYISSGNLRVSFDNDHFENTLASQLPFIYIATSTVSTVNVSNSLFTNDSSSAGTNPANFIWDASNLELSDVTANAGGTQTVANFVHVSTAANLDVYGLVNNNTAYTCVENSIGPCGTNFNGITPFMTVRNDSYPFTIGQTSGNVTQFWNGGAVGMQFDSSGNLTLGAGTIPSFGASNSLDVPGQSLFGNNQFITGGAGIFWNPLATYTRGFIPGVNNDLTFVPYSSAGTASQNNIYFDPTGDIGVGSSTPFGLLSLNLNNGTNYPGNNAFIISSSTASATTTLFAISNTGSTTASNGVNITSGCFAIAGTCIGGSSLSTPVSIANGGTATTTQVTNGVNFFDGTEITSSSTLTLTQAGNVGISTTMPQDPFVIGLDGTTIPDVELGTLLNNSVYGLSMANGRAMLSYTNNEVTLTGGAAKGFQVWVNGTVNSPATGSTGLLITSGNEFLIGTSSTSGGCGANPGTCITTVPQSGAINTLNIASSTGKSLVTVNGDGATSIASSTFTSALGIFGVGNDPTTSNGSSTIVHTGKIQIDGYNTVGSRVCMFIVGTTLTIGHGACTP